MKDYIEKAAALSTHPDDAHIQYIDQITLDRVMNGFAACSADAERLKKQIFKGKNLPNRESIDPIRLTTPKAIDILHADLGVMGEAGEFVEANDRQDVLLEGGDLLWYMAKKFKAYGITFEEAMEANIAKLNARNANKPRLA